MVTGGNKKSTRGRRSDAREVNNVDPDSKEKVAAAHDQAEEDIQQDAEFSSHSPNDDLDEGETARLGEDKTDLVWFQQALLNQQFLIANKVIGAA